MARPRPHVTTTIAVLILFLVAKVISFGEATAIVLRSLHGGSDRHTMFLPLFLSPPPSSSSGNSSPSVRCQIQGSDPLHPNARMLLYDDLLLNGLNDQHVSYCLNHDDHHILFTVLKGRKTSLLKLSYGNAFE